VIVLDASVVADLLGDDGAAGSRARAVVVAEPLLAGPDLIDVETVAVLRRAWLKGALAEHRFEQAVHDLGDLRLARFSTVRC